MNFKAYDILSSLIPGFLTILATLQLLDMPFDKDLVIAYTAVAFLLGYVLNAMSSWAEDFYFWTWGGKPSSNLIDGKGIWKVKFYEHAKTKRLLLDDCENVNASSDELFSTAVRYANGAKDTRIEDFNALYAFSRVLLTTVLLSTIFLLIQHFRDWRYYTVLIPMTLVLWLRCKQRGYYYAKEVLNVYLKIKLP